MPRDGSGVYSRPAGIDAVTDTTIESAKYNLNVQDVEQDLNTPRPIAAGGTGASNAVDAMTALGGELANQVVTNYDTFAFKPGSFASSPGATSEPFPGHYAAGIAYTAGPSMFVEARQFGVAAPSPVKVRENAAGVWGPWTLDSQPSTDLANTKVSKSGDTMTGGLHMVHTTPTIVLTYGTQAQIISRNGTDIVSSNRWVIYPGDTTPESGGNTGSNFAIGRCADSDGSLIDNPIYIARGDGRVIGNGAFPVNGNDFANKGYVDTQVASLTTGVNAKVAKAGDTMSGALIISNTLAADSVQSVGGNYFFQNGTRSLNHDGTNFNFIGGSVVIAPGFYTGGQVTCGNVLANNANISIRALAGGNAVLALQDQAATARGTLYWDRAGGFLSLINAGGFSLLLIDNGTVRTGLGVEGRSGTPGVADGIPHNFYWTGSVNQMWVGTTNLGAVAVTCDYRIKKDVVPLASTWEAVKALKPIEYTQAEFTPPVEKLARVQEAQRAEKENRPSPDKQEALFVADDIKRWGFLAHELQETLLPSAAHGEKDSPNQVQSPNLMAICAALTRSLQEAMARIEALEAA